MATHLELVTEMIACSGALHYAGSHLWQVGETPGVETDLVQVVEHSVPTSLAAEMFGLSFGSLGDRAVAFGLIDAAGAVEHRAALEGLATASSQGENDWGLRQAVYRRADTSVPGAQP